MAVSVPGLRGPVGVRATASEERRGTGLRPRTLPLIAGGIATAVLGGAVLWSHGDALDAERALNDNPTDLALRQTLDDRQRRTRLLIGATATGATLTILVSVILAEREHRGSRPMQRSTPRLRVQLDQGHAWIGLKGTY